MSRTHFSAADSVHHVWEGLGLPKEAVSALELKDSGLGIPSSFKIGHIAQVSISLSALTAALLYSYRNKIQVPKVSVGVQDAVTEFKSERLLTLNGKRPKSTVDQTIGGLHQTSNGYVRVHDGFPNHRRATKRLLGLEDKSDRAAVAEKVAKWAAIDFETAGSDSGLALAALRSYEQWDVTPQAKAIADFPILIRKLRNGPPGLFSPLKRSKHHRSLEGLRVVEMTRVIAAPVAGRTLAAHGADVLWVTSPNLPDQPDLDLDTARGKRTARLDIDQANEKHTLYNLLENAHVFLQSYRPGSLAHKGLAPEDLATRSKKGIICANLSAYGPIGPWSDRRGFDSLVQTSSGMQISEAEHYGINEVARPTPVQALDHASGYFLAAGINAALYKQAIEGGSYEVIVSLAGTMKYLRSLGQYEGRSGFDCHDLRTPEEVYAERFEERSSAFGTLRAVKHSAYIEGVAVGWDIMPKPLGSDEAVWQN